MAESRSAPLLTLLKAPMVAAYTAAGFWGDETIYHLAARHARTMRQAYAVRDRRREFFFKPKYNRVPLGFCLVLPEVLPSVPRPTARTAACSYSRNLNVEVKCRNQSP
jgi:hypothetical protein